MITFAAPAGLLSSLRASGDGESNWYLFSGDRLLVSENLNMMPTSPLLLTLQQLYLGTLGEKHLYAGDVGLEEKAPEGWVWSDLRALFGAIDEEKYAIAGRALQMIDWERTNQFCGRCGAKTFSRDHERCKECSSCGHLFYPKLAPAIMALVRREGQILLARGPHFPEKMYSVLAGFLDPGETLEQCVEREVFEEVGVKVKNIRYFASQPWPFSRALMVGFHCDWVSGDIQPNPLELEDAQWFDRSALPEIPTPLSLAHNLIDQA